MIEIHLDTSSTVPSIEKSDVALRLIMHPEIPITEALDICQNDIPTGYHESFIALYSDRQVRRRFEVLNGVVVIRYESSNAF